MQLRPYEQADWARVCEIYDLAKPDEMRGVIDRQSIRRLQDFPAMLDEFSRSTIVVALLPAGVVGFAGFMGSPTGCVLNWLYVHPEARRVGVASALVTHLLEILAPPVRLNAVAGNAPARALYERLGFVLEREFAGQFQDRPCPVVRLQWNGRAAGPRPRRLV